MKTFANMQPTSNEINFERTGGCTWLIWTGLTNRIFLYMSLQQLFKLEIKTRLLLTNVKFQLQLICIR